MQLGARWRVGTHPHRSVPPALHPLIAEQEAEHPQAVSWTLTWLEGRPRCSLDDLVIVTLDAGGTPRREAAVSDAPVHGAEDEDDWLS